MFNQHECKLPSEDRQIFIILAVVYNDKGNTILNNTVLKYCLEMIGLNEFSKEKYVFPCKSPNRNS